MTREELMEELEDITNKIVGHVNCLKADISEKEGDYVLRTDLESIARAAGNGISKIIIWGETNE